MLLRLIQYKQQNLRTESEIVLNGTLSKYKFTHIDDFDINENSIPFYLPNTLFGGEYYYVAKYRTSIMR